MSENKWGALPAVVQLMGHSMIAGWITEETHVGTEMLRVDVPETESTPAFTNFYGGSAIYSVTPVDEATMRAAVQQARVKPINVYIIAERQIAGTKPYEIWEDEGDDIPFE
jgi:hypothetical protein